MTTIRKNLIETGINAWGVTNTWPEEISGLIPVHDEGHIAIRGSVLWRDCVNAPEVVNEMSSIYFA